MNNKILILVLCAMSFMSLDVFSQAPWKLEKSEDGIEVYTRDEKDSDFKSFKAVVMVDASSDEIIKVLKNADSYSKWYGYTRTSKLLKQGQDLQYNYVETIFPWPYKNRDMVYEMTFNTLNQKVIKISLKGLPEYIPENKGIVRMKKAEGYILLKTLKRMTEISYEFHSEPGDNVPSWLANNSIAELPFKTLYGLREILKEN